MHFYKKIEALGTEIEIYLQDKLERDFTADFAYLEKVILDFEQSFSRFLDNSEINRLNQSVDTFSASDELTKILLLAKNYYQKTEGIFDPTILQSLENLGYKKSFPFISSDDNNNGRSEINFQKIIINESEKKISRPKNLKIDLGGIGKGFLVDKLVDIIKTNDYRNFWVSAGGDMHLYGLAENNEPHQVGIQNPLDPEKDIIYIQIPEQGLAVATSGIAKRRWTKNGRSYHHLIDPRTGLSTDNNLLAVTIVANTVVEADIFAKTVFILGQEQGLNFINEHDNIEGLLINKSNKIIFSQNMVNYLIRL